ncbi:MAG: N5-carboxyaminoimidazole ribonucleotide mutase [Alphaproteobacteria bacterium MarineAlpha6_Bin4]|nr:MAG: N5-carboxyaminoimidazole ribonucleotide mutase [Alphaproteobacteria bacterium MarineAlpha6_Bin3]PPR38021.1 MAG: N5-carboxyaminoimidazole ribonucleotide mutase [Alphaproteobacteria bacterium MarineAlpha6_Bin4]|tara:strand:+ start:43 stop:525 length:483 start_codon:yes stop_codon:yes gene_type:complete
MNDIKVAIIMGSESDAEEMKPASDILNELKIKNETRVISAHRTPDRLREYIKDSEKNGVKVFIAGAGMAAALPGVIAAYTLLPVLGVPIESKSLKGIDSLLSIVQMPPGIPVGTLAIGSPGSKNAGLLAAAILAIEDKDLTDRLKDFRKKQSEKVRKDPL